MGNEQQDEQAEEEVLDILIEKAMGVYEDVVQMPPDEILSFLTGLVNSVDVAVAIYKCCDTCETNHLHLIKGNMESWQTDRRFTCTAIPCGGLEDALALAAFFGGDERRPAGVVLQ